MKNFSERIGVVSPRSAIQRGEMSDRLRNRLWSVCDGVFWQHLDTYLFRDQFTKLLLREVQDGFFGLPVDELDESSHSNVKVIKRRIFQAQWYEFYDLIQFMADLSNVRGSGEPFPKMRKQAEIFINSANDVLETEKSAYRFIGRTLTEITDEGEIAELEAAIAAPEAFAGAKEHISTALTLYSDRDRPDYRNSVKEAVSAIEATFSVINGEKSNSLLAAFKLAEKNGFALHPALKKGILNIYGWTSDEEGVRHALFENDGEVGEAQAKLMLVLCSALMNFLILKQM